MVVAGQVANFLIFVAIGYILKKSCLVDEKSGGVLSRLLVYVFLPCLNFNTFSSRFTPENLRENYNILIYSLVIVTLCVILSGFLAKLFTKDKYEQGIYSYTLSIPNYGYTGYAIMLSLYGEQMLFLMMMFTITLSLYIYTFGYKNLLGTEKISFKTLLNPSMISIAIGMIFGLFGIPLPSFIKSTLSSAANCITPTSMIMTGIVLAGYDLKRVLFSKKAYIVSFFRLVVIPVLICSVLKLINAPKHIITVCAVTYSMSSGLNTIVFPKLAGKDCNLGVSFALISSLFSIITIPIVNSLF